MQANSLRSAFALTMREFTNENLKEEITYGGNVLKREYPKTLVFRVSYVPNSQGKKFTSEEITKGEISKGGNILRGE